MKLHLKPALHLNLCTTINVTCILHALFLFIHYILVREFSRAVRQEITLERKASGFLIRLLLISYIHHFLPSKLLPGSSTCKQLIEDMQGKTEKKKKQTPSIRYNSFKK